MKISVITVAFNSEATIRDTIHSVLSQKNIDLEYIIIDGGSRDKTMEIIKSFGNRIHTVISEPDKGIYDAMNKGINLATGDIVGILNSDDVYASDNVLSKISEKFTVEISGVYADLVYVQKDDLNKVKRTWISGNYVEGSFKKGWMPPHPAFFVRRKVYKEFGGYTLKLKSAADYEFMLRVVHKHKIKLAYLPEIIVKMRVGGKSNVSVTNRIKANREDRQAWKMNGLKPGAFTLLRKPLSKIGQFLGR
jgi:glycosyltransferase involved in cell wall biosynthesis